MSDPIVALLLVTAVSLGSVGLLIALLAIPIHLAIDASWWRVPQTTARLRWGLLELDARARFRPPRAWLADLELDDLPLLVLVTVLRGRADAWATEIRLNASGCRLPHRPMFRTLHRIGTFIASLRRPQPRWHPRLLLTEEGLRAEIEAFRAAQAALQGRAPVAASQIGATVAHLTALLGLSCRLTLRIGTEDPFLLGVLWSLVAVMPAGAVTILPGWDEEPLQGEGLVRVRVVPLRLALSLLRDLLLTSAGRCTCYAFLAWARSPRPVVPLPEPSV